MARAPYNFVPSDDRVFYPAGADKISFDVPFRDGISGKISYELTAQTPVFVRNGHVLDQKDDHFSIFDGKYFIPATSIKGVIRNVLKVISFGSLDSSFTDGYSPEVGGEEKKPDLAECIFGCVDKPASLKGRVQFTPCWSKQVRTAGDVYVQLIGPHPELHYLYGRKKGAECVPKGRKRYVLKETVPNLSTRREGTTVSRMIPLGKDSVFCGEVFFHNLRPFELGALLSAMTFFGQEDKFFHQIGQGKPYGFGRMSLTLTGIKTDLPGAPGFYRDEEIAYIRQYVDFMNNFGFDVKNAPSVRELLVLCSFVVKPNDARFQYMGRNADTSPLPFLSELEGIRVPAFPDWDALLHEWRQKEEARLVKEREDAAALEAAGKDKEILDAFHVLMDLVKTKWDTGCMDEAASAYEQSNQLWNDHRPFFLENASPEIFKFRKDFSERFPVSSKPSVGDSGELAAEDLLRLNSINAVITMAKKKKPLSPSAQEMVKNRIMAILEGMKTKDRKSYRDVKRWKVLDDLDLEQDVRNQWIELFIV